MRRTSFSFSTLTVIGVLLLLAGNLVATVRSATLMDLLLAQTMAAEESQEAVTEWTDVYGLHQQLHTQRATGVSEEAWRAYHQEAVRGFLVDFPVKP